MSKELLVLIYGLYKKFMTPERRKATDDTVTDMWKIVLAKGTREFADWVDGEDRRKPFSA